MTPRVGDRCCIVLDSWAGRTHHLVEVLKVCPKRVKVRWLGHSVLRHYRGEIYYVPPESLRALDESWVEHLDAHGDRRNARQAPASGAAGESNGPAVEADGAGKERRTNATP